MSKRAKNPNKSVGLFIKFPPSFAKAIKSSQSRKGMSQSKYLQRCMTIADKEIKKVKPLITFYARPIAKKS